MANDKYTLDVAINAADAANSLKEVKQSLRELKNIQLEFGEGTEEYRKASQKIGELKDKMNVNCFAQIICDSSKGKLNINKKKNWLCNLFKI